MSTEECALHIVNTAKELLGVKQTWWREGEEGANYTDHILYANRLPTNNELVEHGVNCAGFLNVVLQMCGLQVPSEGVDEQYIRGGTAHWGRWFRMKNILEPFDDAKSYPVGTILFTDQVSDEEQGHISIVCDLWMRDPTKILYASIIHSYPEVGVGITSVGGSHFQDFTPERGGYIQQAVTPDKYIPVLLEQVEGTL